MRLTPVHPLRGHRLRRERTGPDAMGHVTATFEIGRVLVGCSNTVAHDSDFATVGVKELDGTDMHCRVRSKDRSRMLIAVRPRMVDRSSFCDAPGRKFEKRCRRAAAFTELHDFNERVIAVPA